MLVLSRKLNEVIEIDGGIRIQICAIGAERVRIGIEAPKDVHVRREEVCAGFAKISHSETGKPSSLEPGCDFSARSARDFSGISRKRNMTAGRSAVK